MKHFRPLSFLLVVICLIISLGGCISYTAPPSGPQLAANISNQTVALVTDLPDNFDPRHQAFCTGVWLNDTTILTAAHCVVGYADITYKVAVMHALITHGVDPVLVRMMISMGLLELINVNDPTLSPQMQQIALVIASVPPIKPLGLSIPFVVQSQTVDVGVPSTGMQYATAYIYSSRDDLALLRVKGPFHYQHPHVILADKSPYVGEDIEIVGQSQSVWWSYKKGIVSAYRHDLSQAGMEDKDGPFMQITGASIVGGDSGSGVFNNRGELVGTVSFIKPSLQAGFAIHLDTIKGFLIGRRLLKADLSQ